jgi:hypothetical protein
VAAGVFAGIAGEVLGRRKECHEQSIVMGAESAANMPCALRFSHDFARSRPRAMGCNRRLQPAALTFP